MENTKNSYYLNNDALPTENSQFEFTPDMVKSLKKSSNDIVHFAENFFYIVNLDRGKEIIKLYKAQKRVLKSLAKNNRVVLLSSRQAGKALDINTPIPTLNGYIKMGDLKDGDQIYDENGNICTILKAHEIYYNHDCYEITFDSGEKIIADKDHLWCTQTKKERRQKIINSIKTTEEIFQTLHEYNSKEPNHRIIKSKGLQGLKKDLIIDPYILGVWLGDGHSAGSRISVGKQDIDEISKLLNQDYFTIKNDGHGNFNYSINGENKKHATDCFKKQLNRLNLLNNKHIPKDYLLSSFEQRLEILRGLMDTDGYVSKKGKCDITSSNAVLANDIITLITSLGFKTNIKVKTFTNINHKPSTRIIFTPNIPVFKLQRKLDRQLLKKQTPSYNRLNFNYIQDIKKVASVPVRCITVDSPNSLYLCGKTHIITHNTTLVTIFALWFCAFNKDKSILIVANKERTAIEILGRIRLAYEMLPNWIKPGVKDYSKTNILFANDSRIYVSTTASTAGRSSSINCLIIDEAAHIDRFKEDEFVKSIMPVISSSGKTKIFMISTPNGTSNHFYKTYSGAERGENGWKNEKIDWPEVPGRDEIWKQKAIADLGSIEAFQQEYGNVFVETGETAIDKDLISEFRSMARKPEIFDSSEYKVWLKPDPKAIYIMGADVSDGVGGCASCLQGLDITDLTNIKQAFMYWNKFVDTAHFAKEIFDISKQWGKPPLAIERNSMGGEVVNFLTGRPYNYEHIISYNNDKQVEYEKGGIYSSTNVKYEGVSNMRYWINALRAVNLYDIATIQEIETFVKYPNGTWHKQPGDGILDDRVMALLWALFGLHTPIAEVMFEVLQYDERGKVLKLRKNSADDDEFYGINQYRKNWSDDDFVPAFISTKRGDSVANPEMEDLILDGWTTLNNM